MTQALACIIAGFALMYGGLLWHLFHSLQGRVDPQQLWKSIAALWNPLEWRTLLGNQQTRGPVLVSMLGLALIVTGAALGWMMTSQRMIAS